MIKVTFEAADLSALRKEIQEFAVAHLNLNLSVKEKSPDGVIAGNVETSDSPAVVPATPNVPTVDVKPESEFKPEIKKRGRPRKEKPADLPKVKSVYRMNSKLAEKNQERYAEAEKVAAEAERKARRDEAHQPISDAVNEAAKEGPTPNIAPESSPAVAGPATPEPTADAAMPGWTPAGPPKFEQALAELMDTPTAPAEPASLAIPAKPAIEPTFDNCREALRHVFQDVFGDLEKTRQWMHEKFQVGKVKELKESQYADFIEACYNLKK